MAGAQHGSGLVGNPTRPAAAVTDARACAAHRPAHHQVNSHELAAALSVLAHQVSSVSTRNCDVDDGYEKMIAGHARVVREVRDMCAHRCRR